MPAQDGRRKQAARNSEAILASARAVFLADPSASIAEVAKHAGVGISALYRRYPSKEELLRTLCGEGLEQYIAVAQVALAADLPAWERFERFMEGVVDADCSGLTRGLAGTFMPTPELDARAGEAAELGGRLFIAAQRAGAIRPDAEINDVATVLEQLSSVQLGDAARTSALRRRYLRLALDGLRAGAGLPGDAPALPGRAPTGAELGERWRPPEV